MKIILLLWSDGKMKKRILVFVFKKTKQNANLIGRNNELKRTLTIMATCSAWKKPRARPHQALHLSLSYKQPRLLFWSARSKIKRKKSSRGFEIKGQNQSNTRRFLGHLATCSFCILASSTPSPPSRSGMNTKLDLSLCYMTFPVVVWNFLHFSPGILTAVAHF